MCHEKLSEGDIIGQAEPRAMQQVREWPYTIAIITDSTAINIISFLLQGKSVSVLVL